VERHQKAIAWLRGEVTLLSGASETYCGVKIRRSDFLSFGILWRERHSLWRFLKWTGEMERYVIPTKNHKVSRFHRVSRFQSLATFINQL